MWLDTIADDAVSAAGGSPLHRQLGLLLRAAIADGSLPPGTLLPTEAELQAKFGVSRSVIRQALSGLTTDGLIQRGRGRGTVVAPHHEHHRQVQRMHGLSAQISTIADPVSTEVLTLEHETDPRAIDPRAAEALNTTDLVSLRRRRSAEGEAIALIHTWLPHAIAGTLTAAALTNASLHATLAAECGVPVTAGKRQIRAVAASASIAAELSVPVGAPLLVLEGTSVDDHGQPVEFFSTWHRADRVVFDLDVNGSTGGYSAGGGHSTARVGVGNVGPVVPGVSAHATDLELGQVAGAWPASTGTDTVAPGAAPSGVAASGVAASGVAASGVADPSSSESVHPGRTTDTHGSPASNRKIVTRIQALTHELNELTSRLS